MGVGTRPPPLRSKELACSRPQRSWRLRVASVDPTGWPSTADIGFPTASPTAHRTAAFSNNRPRRRSGVPPTYPRVPSPPPLAIHAPSNEAAPVRGPGPLRAVFTAICARNWRTTCLRLRAWLHGGRPEGLTRQGLKGCGEFGLPKSHPWCSPVRLAILKCTLVSSAVNTDD